MNWNTIAGDWTEFREKVKEQWGRLTDDELDQIDGQRDQLVGVLQKHYGVTKESAEKQIQAFEMDCDCW